MKRISLIIILLTCLLTASCDKFPAKNYDVTGSWMVVKMDVATKSIQVGEEIVDLYISFNEDNSFNIYQKVGTGRYRVYVGTWVREKNILSGTYKDNTPWACSYLVYKEEDGKTLTLIANNESNERMILTSCSIPQEVKDYFINPDAK